jgi:FkbM family methyltransferase
MSVRQATAKTGSPWYIDAERNIVRTKMHAENPFLVMQRLLIGVEQPIIFDVGAHIGEVSRAFREFFPTSTIYAFEPFPESFAKLQDNTSSDPNIKAFNFGLSEQDRMRDFHSNPSSATNSLFSTDERGPRTWAAGLLETKEIIQAEFRSIDSVVASLRSRRLIFLSLTFRAPSHWSWQELQRPADESSSASSTVKS